jgi:hypothetical protein
MPYSIQINKLINKTKKMKKLFAMLLCGIIFISCSSLQGAVNIEPKTGTIEISANGEFRMWKDIKHASFTVLITNLSPTQSVELYKVKSNGNEKWVSPSLLANSSLEVTIPANGHLFIKNFNPNVFVITYKIVE